MTIANSNNRTELAVSGYDYDFTFKIYNESQIKVYGVDAAAALTPLVLTTDYTVDISTISEGGSIQTVVATVPTEPAAYAKILMIRNIPYTQPADIPVRGGFNESVIEQALDVIVMQILQIKDTIDYDADQDPLSVAAAAASAAAAALSATAAAASATAADVSAGAVSAIIVAAIATANHIVTGHDHDGADSKTVSYNNLTDTPIGGKEEFLSDGNFTAPAGVTVVWVTMVGGGGASGYGDGAEYSGGGGGGQTILKHRVALDALEVVAVDIGAGGTKGVVGSKDGGDGAVTTFAANSGTITAKAGGGSDEGDSTGGVGGTQVIDGGDEGGAGGSPGFSGGDGGDATSHGGGGGGTVLFGYGPTQPTASADGVDGPANTGVGAAGGGNNHDGGAGGSGYCLVEW